MSEIYRLYEEGRPVSRQQHETLDDAIAEAGGCAWVDPSPCGKRWGLGGHDAAYAVHLEPRTIGWWQKVKKAWRR